ncbi:neutral zinc metallopeptidase [Kribbella sp. NPDC051718]|uniref:neutral zinc metallopeptidase n=1 Tax=Kribbella sp. NPDC051718 TaxID=3155168 RepID=UPI003439B225
MADDERVPEPGHFLPGSDVPAGAASPVAPTSKPGLGLGLGEARPISVSQEPARKKAAPLPDDPEYQGFYSGPPAAPLPDAPTGPLGGTRQFGRVRYAGWKARTPRTGVQQFSTHSPYRKPARQFSQRFVGLISALALVIVAGGTIAAYAKIDSFGNEVTNPLADPSIKPSEGPQSVAPNPTVTVTIPAVPDEVRLQKNKLYTVGKLRSVNCALPKVKPNSKANVLRFYQAMMPCLAQTWEDLVLEADYPFRQPKLALVVKGTTPACGGDLPDTSFYCPNDETIYMRWEDEVKFYKRNPNAVVDLVRTVAHEYGHHVQQLTNIMISSQSQEGFAKSKAAELEWSRRLELQASCLGSNFISANQKSLGLVGEKMEFWKILSKNIGDELTKKKIRDHGSSKNYRFWSDQGFKTANPASCNTYTAPPAKVS